MWKTRKSTVYHGNTASGRSRAAARHPDNYNQYRADTLTQVTDMTGEMRMIYSYATEMVAVPVPRSSPMRADRFAGSTPANFIDF